MRPAKSQSNFDDFLHPKRMKTPPNSSTLLSNRTLTSPTNEKISQRSPIYHFSRKEMNPSRGKTPNLSKKSVGFASDFIKPEETPRKDESPNRIQASKIKVLMDKILDTDESGKYIIGETSTKSPDKILIRAASPNSVYNQKISFPDFERNNTSRTHKNRSAMMKSRGPTDESIGKESINFQTDLN